MWNSISDATKMMSPMNNIYISKHITGFLPIGRNMVRRGAWKEPHCPRCPFPMENSAHILRCPSQASRILFRSSMQKFSIWLENVDTPSILTTHILDITASWASGVHTPPQKNSPQPIILQLQLGWDHFTHGRIHQSFLQYITNHYIHISSKRNPSSWISVLIQKLWTLFHLPQWENRNKYVHDLDRVTDSTTSLNGIFCIQNRFLYKNILYNMQHQTNYILRTEIKLVYQNIFYSMQHQSKIYFTYQNQIGLPRTISPV